MTHESLLFEDAVGGGQRARRVSAFLSAAFPDFARCIEIDHDRLLSNSQRTNWHEKTHAVGRVSLRKLSERRGCYGGISCLEELGKTSVSVGIRGSDYNQNEGCMLSDNTN
ncbi:hypothetical protein L798_07568 [Zootermopsis nevadensis]|uniref:Uncharacterized protein n=1 Tax=Zootermopsis nevadensis TaxID=136037 RepID=A0A067REC4_ZOONE|nr:hypothetical protein L798_07568 [Zootermopsis nevadensis]